jgi:hypothetical protein
MSEPPLVGKKYSGTSSAQGDGQYHPAAELMYKGQGPWTCHYQDWEGDFFNTVRQPPSVS